MLTLDEIESTLQIQYELRLEALGEEALRELLDDPSTLRDLAPHHLSDDEVLSIAETTLAELVACKAPPAVPEPGAPPGPPLVWPQFLTWFWTPSR